MEDSKPNVESGDPGATAVPPAVAASPRRRTAMWLAMGSVAVALAALTFAPHADTGDDAPPPAASGAAGDHAATGAIPGRDAPLDFTIKDMHGVDVKLASFKGKIILINFWATWCGPCREEIPSLVELQAKYPDDLVILGLSVDDPVDKLKPYAEQFGMNYPVLVGSGRDDVQDAYGPIWGIPISVLIDREGKVFKKHSGIASKEQFEQEIRSLL